MKSNGRKIRIILVVAMMLVLMASCTKPPQKESGEKTKTPEVIDLSNDKDVNKLDPEIWESGKGYADASDPEVHKGWGYSFIYSNKAREQLFPIQNKFDIKYYPKEERIDSSFFIPKGAVLNDKELEEDINIFYSVDLKNNKLLKYTQENMDGKPVEYYKIDEETLLYHAKRDVRRTQE